MRGTPPGMPYAWNPKSRPSAEKREGAGVGLPGTGSPRRILALARCRQHEMTAYQRLISAEGSRPVELGLAVWIVVAGASIFDLLADVTYMCCSLIHPPTLRCSYAGGAGQCTVDRSHPTAVKKQIGRAHV